MTPFLFVSTSQLDIFCSSVLFFPLVEKQQGLTFSENEKTNSSSCPSTFTCDWLNHSCQAPSGHALPGLALLCNDHLRLQSCLVIPQNRTLFSPVRWFLTADGRNFLILRDAEVIPARTRFGLNFMPTRTVCLWPITHTLYICPNH